MSKILVLAEKPSVGKELARVLGCKQGRDGHIVGDKYIVTWSLGHLVTLAGPEMYGDLWKEWKLENLPMLPKKMDLVVINDTKKQFNVVKMLMQSPEISELVIATDAGREGELVARWIMQKSGFRKPAKRLWISSQTDKAILEGFRTLKPSREYDNLFHSAQCRAEADWLVGLNITRALTCKYNAQLSAGRVQTPTLSMIVERETEIKRFVPKEYYFITANVNGFSLTWRDKNNNPRIFDKDAALNIVKKCTAQSAKVINIKKELKRELPPLLYDLTELQRDANKRFGYGAKKTLSLMQSLYETHKLLTYPRTDSKYLTDDIVPTLPERLKSIAVGAYREKASQILIKGVKTSKRFVDNSKVSDHHAIIPTEQYVNISALSSDEKNIYNLVVMRFLAALSLDFVYEQTVVLADVLGEHFYASGKIVKESGWKAIYGKAVDDDNADKDEKEQSLPPINQGETLKILDVRMGTGKTKPPARYTEGTLLSAMEHPGKFLDDKRLSEVVESTGGLGTPATRADIIEKLFSSAYIEKQGQSLFPTSKGIQVIDLAPVDLKSAELTAKWEKQLGLISKGQSSPIAFIDEMKLYSSKLVSAVIASSAAYHHDNLTKTRCPNCSKFMLEINGKKGKMLVCQDKDCGYRQNLSYLSNARCPQCHKKLEVFGEGDKRIYTCPCGFREKFDRFNKELEQKHSSMNKKELATYMREQEADKGLGTLADALKNIKL